METSAYPLLLALVHKLPTHVLIQMAISVQIIAEMLYNQ